MVWGITNFYIIPVSVSTGATSRCWNTEISTNMQLWIWPSIHSNCIFKHEINEVSVNSCNITCISKWSNKNAHYERPWYRIYSTFTQQNVFGQKIMKNPLTTQENNLSAVWKKESQRRNTYTIFICVKYLLKSAGEINNFGCWSKRN